MRFFRFIYLAFLLTFSGVSHASSISFGLNQNNIGFGNDTDYATVTISDGNNMGDIDFLVTLNHDFFNFDDKSNFGLQSFYFNSLFDLTGRGTTISGHAGWSLNTDFGSDRNDGYNASEFGRFNLQYKGKGNSRADPLKFTISSKETRLMTYALGNDKGFGFVAHVAGFDNYGVTSGWYSTPMSPIPVPAAVWLFGSALLGLIGYSKNGPV